MVLREMAEVHELDVLAIGNCYLRKEEQNPALRQNYEMAFEPD